MFNFCGWSMPLQYSSPSVEHRSVRSFLGLFDVSHMRQVILQGDDVVELLELTTLADVGLMTAGSCQYTVMLNEKAGIIDDLVLTRDSEDTFYAVLNCSQAAGDIAHLTAIIDRNKWDVSLEVLNTSLLAVQGPEAMECLQRGFDTRLNNLRFLNSLPSVTAFGIPNCRLSRVGYTGEDGFELMVPNDCAEFVAQEVLGFCKGDKRGVMAGLSARDSLRIEAGLCLYGNELTESTNIKEAGLSWLLSPIKISERAFIGYENMNLLLDAPRRIVRVGLVTDTKNPLMRAGTNIFDWNGRILGYVTSSCVGYHLDSHIAMAYIEYGSRKSTSALFEVRGKKYEAHITKLPFIVPQYYTVVV